MSQKSLFAKFTSLFHKTKAKYGGSTLSANEAISVQNTYIHTYCDLEAPLLPPYYEIIKQLYSPQTEIFNAALFYLQKIAANEKLEAEGIIGKLQNILTEKNKISAEHKNQIGQALQKIQKN